VTTIFSVANAIALRSVPGVSNADELVEVNRMLAVGEGRLWASYPFYRHLRDGGGSEPVAHIAAWSMMPLMISTGAEGVAAQGTLVTGTTSACSACGRRSEASSRRTRKIRRARTLWT